MASERYEKLFNSEKNLYSEGSPVIILAGALLKDNLDDSLVAQIKFKNIANKRIISIKVQISLFDSVGRALEDVVDFEYLDLRESRDTEFGHKTPIHIPNNSARRFAVNIREVCFDDDTVWHALSGEWTSIDPQETIDAIFDDSDIKEQYLIEHGDKFIYQVTEYKDIWMCACGAINRFDEKECHSCGHSAEFFEVSDFGKLKENREKRLEAQKQAQKEKSRKLVIALAAVLAFVVLGIIGASIYKIFTFYRPTYERAMALYERQEYSSAQKEFLKIKIYKDSSRKIQECTDGMNELSYLEACEMLENEEYEYAKEFFKRLGDYKDSKDKVLECTNSKKYAEAIESLCDGDFDEAKDIFVELGSFRDSAEKVQEWSNVVKYYTAENYWKTGYYQEALEAFSSLGTFDDSEEKYAEYFEESKEYKEVITILRSYSNGSSDKGAFQKYKWKLLEKNGNVATLICLDDAYGYEMKEEKSLYEMMKREYRYLFNENELGYVKNISLPSKEILKESRPFNDHSVISIDHYWTGNIEGYIERESSNGKEWWFFRPVVEVYLK